jgi:hypothetical protein
MGTVISIAFGFLSLRGRFASIASRRRHRKSKNASKASPEKAGVGGSMPSLATI